MPEPLWKPAQIFDVPAKSGHGYWTRVIDYVDAGQWLKFLVEDVPAPGAAPVGGGGVAHQPRPPTWSYAPQLNCGADGDPTGPLNPASCLVTTAAPGALVGKIGGSSGGRADDGHVFVVGSFCLLYMDTNTRGTLYLAMNVDPSRPTQKSGSLNVSVFTAS